MDLEIGIVPAKVGILIPMIPGSGVLTVDKNVGALTQDALIRFRRNKAAMFSLFLLIALIVAAFAGPAFIPFNYEDPDWVAFRAPPSLESGHYFGTDQNGRDLLARTLYGTRISLAVALVATLVSVVIGVTYGSVAGYLGGRADQAMMQFVDIMYALPYILFVILLMVVFERNFFLIFVAIGAINWLDMARIVRGQTLSLREREFVDAARLTGVSAARIVLRHIAPNLTNGTMIRFCNRRVNRGSSRAVRLYDGARISYFRFALDRKSVQVDPY